MSPTASRSRRYPGRPRPAPRGRPAPPTPWLLAARGLLGLWVVAALAATGTATAAAQAAADAEPRAIVIVHGAWGGGWAWRDVGYRLVAEGHRVYRPTLTGLGERTHLASAEVDLSTHVQDVVNLLRFEQLEGVVLVGHSYGGMVITGVAAAVPERVAHLVYVDAFVPEEGESALALLGAENAARIEEWVQDGLIVPPWIDPARGPPGDVPHPLASFAEPLRFPDGERPATPATYILAVDPGSGDAPFARYADRARELGWVVERIDSDHNPQRSLPAELTTMLLEAARR